MMKIDIERLIDAVVAENEAYADYCQSAKNLYRGPFAELESRKEYLEYAREISDRENSSVCTIIEIFDLDKEAQKRLYTAARSVRRWRIATEYAQLIPDTMKKQIERFIFGTPVPYSSLCYSCGCWEV